MDEKICHCQDCGWLGEAPIPYDAHQKRELLDSLRPGDVVPAGVCPACGGNAIPGPVFHGRIACIELEGQGGKGAPDAVWDATLSQIGDSLVLHLANPAGFGAEIVAEISHERPTLHISSWSVPEDLAEADVLAHVKIGEGHVLTTPDPAYPALVVADGRELRSKISPPGAWDLYRRWGDQPA